jgi:hypothetical protein
VKKWILVVAIVLSCGCAGQRARVVVTRVNGEPSVSFEFEKETGCEQSNLQDHARAN